MNPIKIAMLSAAALIAVSGWSDADARGGGRGHGHGGHHHSHWRGSVGIWFGAPFFPYYYPRYYYPSYYYPPAYYPYYPSTTVIPAPGSPSVYIEQNPPAAAPQSAPAPAQGSGSYWYYCRDTQTYYPYVQQCASPWQQVVPHAPGPQSGPETAPSHTPAPSSAPFDGPPSA